MRAAYAVAAAVRGGLVFSSAKYAIKISKPGDSGQQTRSAFLRWREMLNGVFAGENIYVGVNEYPNPPIMALLLRPYAVLPPVAGALAWFYTKVLLAVLSAIWLFRLVGGRGTPASGVGSRPPLPEHRFPAVLGGTSVFRSAGPPMFRCAGRSAPRERERRNERAFAPG